MGYSGWKGRPNATFFLKDLLATEGSTLLHSTGRRDIMWGTGLEPSCHCEKDILISTEKMYLDDY